MPRKKVPSSSSLGKSLMKDKMKKPNRIIDGEGPQGGFKVHTTIETDADRPKLVSVLEQSSLDEFVSLAALSNKQFEAEKGITIISGNTMVPIG